MDPLGLDRSSSVYLDPLLDTYFETVLKAFFFDFKCAPRYIITIYIKRSSLKGTLSRSLLNATVENSKFVSDAEC